MNEDIERRTVARREGDPDPSEPGGFRLSKNIDLSHVLTVLMMLGALAFQWNLIDKRLAVLEEARQSQRERDQAQDALTKDKFQEVRDALAVLTRSVEKVSDKMEAHK